MSNINRVGEFEKVSYEQFYAAVKDQFYADMWTGEEIQQAYDNIVIPQRATSGSCGFDFKAPFGFMIPIGTSMKIPTGIRVRIDEGWWLGCLPRSSLGFKYRAQLDNTVGVIDSDYYYSDNEGHIFIKLTNDSKEGKMVDIHPGDGFVQAIFIPYGITYSDDVQTVRNGGMGSTGR